MKIEYLRCKARLVASGYMTKTPNCQTYYSIISHDTVRIALTIDALNDLQIKAGGIMIACVTAPINEKVWTLLVNEWGADDVNKSTTFRDLYGLKSAGASFRKHLADFMIHRGYNLCPDYLDMWINPNAETGGNSYYSYIL